MNRFLILTILTIIAITYLFYIVKYEFININFVENFGYASIDSNGNIKDYNNLFENRVKEISFGYNQNLKDVSDNDYYLVNAKVPYISDPSSGKIYYQTATNGNLLDVLEIKGAANNYSNKLRTRINGELHTTDEILIQSNMTDRVGGTSKIWVNIGDGTKDDHRLQIIGAGNNRKIQLESRRVLLDGELCLKKNAGGYRCITAENLQNVTGTTDRTS